MAKGKRILPGQMAFAFDAPVTAKRPAALAGLERRISEVVAKILNTEQAAGQPREVIAAKMSVLLDEDISRAMLDAYASPARDQHKVPMSRFFALIAVTDRHDLFDTLVREIGGTVLVGEEVYTARLGHIERQMAALQEEKRRLRGDAPLITRGGI